MVIGCFAIWLRFSGLALIDWCVCVGLLGVVGLLFICCLLIAVVFCKFDRVDVLLLL